MPKLLSIAALLLIMSIGVNGQNLYTARSYWQESTKPAYITILDKWESGQTLTANEAAYKQDYETYLLNYFNRLSVDEQLIYQQMKDEWDRELDALQTPVGPRQSQEPQQPLEKAEFEWRGRDRANNALYGIYYGATLAAIANLEAPAAPGLSLLTGGVWMLGPAVNPKKYEGITASTMRAANTGKILGMMYGASLGLATFGESGDPTKVILGLSTIGSITLGELAFQTQKRKNISGGKVELMRHYGFLGTGVGGSLLAATEINNVNLIGAGLLSGGVGGLLLGSRAANRYDYTRGDVDALSALGVIGAGLGFALIANTAENNGEFARGIWLLPASVAVAGTLVGQRQVRGVYLTKKQGSTINLSSAGGALVGAGVMLMVNADSPTAWIAVPSLLSLAVHQLVFNGYKKENLLQGLRGESMRDRKFDVSLQLMPENYFINQQSPAHVSADPRLATASPLVNVTIKFR